MTLTIMELCLVFSLSTTSIGGKWAVIWPLATTVSKAFSMTLTIMELCLVFSLSITSVGGKWAVIWPLATTVFYQLC